LVARPFISILIVNYNAGERLSKCLSHIEEQSFRDFEVFLLDNASTDNSLEYLETYSFPMTIIKSEHNLGFAAGNNRAAKNARGKWIAFLNPDAYANSDWLQKLVAATRKYPNVDAFGSTQINALEPDKLDGAGDVYHAFGVAYRGLFGAPIHQLPGDGECFSPCAAAALYRRRTFEDLGGFDEDFYCYGEDVDLGFRLRLKGGRAIQIADAVVHHEGSAISGRYTDFTVYHGNRNRIWGYFKNMPLALLLLTLPFHVMANFYLLVRSASVGIGKPYWRALKDGYCGLGPILKKRQYIQRQYIVRIGDIARALTWSITKVSRREADLKKIHDNAYHMPHDNK